MAPEQKEAEHHRDTSEQVSAQPRFCEKRGLILRATKIAENMEYKLEKMGLNLEVIENPIFSKKDWMKF